MNEYKAIVDGILEFLKGKELLSQLEKDILSTSQLCIERPIDRTKATQKLIELDCRYEDIGMRAKTMPGTQLVPVNCLSDEDLIVDLYVRLVGLCVKKQQELDKKNSFLNSTYK